MVRGATFQPFLRHLPAFAHFQNRNQVVCLQSIRCCSSTRIALRNSCSRSTFRYAPPLPPPPSYHEFSVCHHVNRSFNPQRAHTSSSSLHGPHRNAHIFTLHKSLGSCFCISSFTVLSPLLANNALKCALLLLKLHPSKSRRVPQPPLPVSTFSLRIMTPVCLREALRRQSKGTKSSSVTWPIAHCSVLQYTTFRL